MANVNQCLFIKSKESKTRREATGLISNVVLICKTQPLFWSQVFTVVTPWYGIVMAKNALYSKPICTYSMYLCTYLPYYTSSLCLPLSFDFCRLK